MLDRRIAGLSDTVGACFLLAASLAGLSLPSTSRVPLPGPRQPRPHARFGGAELRTAPAGGFGTLRLDSAVFCRLSTRGQAKTGFKQGVPRNKELGQKKKKTKKKNGIVARPGISAAVGENLTTRGKVCRQEAGVCLQLVPRASPTCVPPLPGGGLLWGMTFCSPRWPGAG